MDTIKSKPKSPGTPNLLTMTSSKIRQEVNHPILLLIIKQTYRIVGKIPANNSVSMYNSH